MRAVLSYDAVATCEPSGEKDTQYAQSVCGLGPMVNSAAPPLLLHNFAVLSSPEVAILVPSGDHVTERT